MTIYEAQEFAASGQQLPADAVNAMGQPAYADVIAASSPRSSDARHPAVVAAEIKEDRGEPLTASDRNALATDEAGEPVNVGMLRG